MTFPHPCIKPTNNIICLVQAPLNLKSFVLMLYLLLYYRKEIQATLERLKRAERNLTAKEQQLREREMKISEREKSLEQQFKVVVSFVDLCLSLWPFSFGHCVVCPASIIQILITPLISSNSSYKIYLYFDIIMKRIFKQ